MALTLDSTLQTRLDGIERQPEIEILSSEFAESIPFQGNSFGIAGSDVFNPQIINHSSGRLGQLYIESDGSFIWMYTDETRSQWTTVDLSAIINEHVEYASAVELANGNIGVIAITGQTDRRLKQFTISIIGSVISGLSQIEDLSDTYDWSSPYVVLLSSGDYYMVYVRKDETTPAYTIYSRTASTWGSWGSASDITPSGVNTSREIDNPSLFETDDGDLFLLFDHVTAIQDAVTIKNIFSSISTDDGSSFGTASARTSYTSYGSNGLDPIMVQRSNGTIWLIFYENRRVLHMDETATGFLSSCSSGLGYGMGNKELGYDYATGKIIVAFGNTSFGVKSLCGIAIVDKDTWSIDKVYYSGSSPQINNIFRDNQIFQLHSDGKYMAANVGNGYGEHSVVMVLNHSSDTIVNYVIDDISISGISDGIPSYNLPRNIEFESGDATGLTTPKVHRVLIDASQDRLYLAFRSGFVGGFKVSFAYIDLTESPDGEGMYTLNWLTPISGVSWTSLTRWQTELDAWNFVRDPDRGYIIFHSGNEYSTIRQAVVIMDEDNNCAVVKETTYDTNNSFPINGIERCIQYNGVLYGHFNYRADYPDTDKRGLIEYNYVTETISYHRPPFWTKDQYYFNDFTVDEDTGIIYIASGEGVLAFDTNTKLFTRYDSETLPGFVRSGEQDAMTQIAFDPVSEDIIAGSVNGGNYLEGILMFNASGYYNQLQYITADKQVTWQWDSQFDLSYYNSEIGPSAAIDEDNVLWVTWSHDDWQNNQKVLYWDNDLGDIDVTNDITGSVSLSWELKRINQLSFSLGNAHLYDPQNLLSTKNVVGQKGRKVQVRIGEKIGEYTYWVNQGIFLVDSSKINYSRGKEMVLNLDCKGKTSLWKQKQISVTALYSGSMPDTVITDLIDDFTQFLSTEYNLPTFDDEHGIYYQWLDKTLYEIIEELVDHFFYAMFEDADGIFTCRRVDLEQDVDHEYSDQMQVIDFTPDDSYSDYTNRVRVIGETNDYTEVVHDEEMITSRAGTVGWWVKEKEETIYFSEDQERHCRNPRLEVKHSPKEYGLLLDQLSTGEGGIRISYIDPYESYIEVEIRVADLTAALIGAIVAMIALGAAAITCDYGKVCGAYMWGLAIAISLILYILAAVAQYQYEVWARPLGRVKTTIQYEANDEELQRKLNGEIVTREFTDPLCNSVTECRRVAEGNLEMLKAQRRRVSFQKITHLQDELLDKIKVYHPYSGEGMEILIVNLKRTYEKGKGVFDKIEGWRYIP